MKRSNARRPLLVVLLLFFESPLLYLLNQPSITELLKLTDWKISLIAFACPSWLEWPWPWPWVTLVKRLTNGINFSLPPSVFLADGNGNISLISCHQLDSIHRFTRVSSFAATLWLPPEGFGDCENAIGQVLEEILQLSAWRFALEIGVVPLVSDVGLELLPPRC